jgi:beta-galactosidase/beta-glucuronidase
MSQPRPEYPRPILARERWINLNGTWDFALDPSDEGLRAGWQSTASFEQKIIVPYTLEAQASGIGNRQAPKVVWYGRDFEVPGAWRQERLMLRFGACDHWARVFVNGQEVGQNRGGYAPFAFDIVHALQAGTNRITVRVEDSPSWSQPRGKQEGTTRWPIDYDGVTGIWQTVWLEPVAKTAIEDIHCGFSLAASQMDVTVGLSGLFDGKLRVAVVEGETVVGTGETSLEGRVEAKVSLRITEPKLWSPTIPHLYDLKLELLDASGSVVDEAISYAGLREIAAGPDGLKINGEPLYIRGVLDQGYFPEGWYTPLDDAAIRRDVELTLALGFNCARKHQKAEDPRYLYWADRLGLLVWAEMPSGRIFSAELVTTLTDEWLRLVRRDRAHPSVMAWVPFNESWGVWNQADRPAQRSFVDGIYHLTRALDGTRPVVGNDGWEYSSGDLWTLHIYEGDGRPVAARLDDVLADPEAQLYTDGRVGALPGGDVSGLPVLLTECGGIGFVPEGYDGDTFAYGDIPETVEELERRFRSIAADVGAAGQLSGFVWTQLTDIQQEINGVLTFDREPKLPLEVMREIFEGVGE